MQKVKIFSTPTCHFCHMAKEYFKANNVPFEDVDVLSNIQARSEMVDISGQMGVPVILIGNDVVVGFNKPKIASLLGLPV